MSERRAKITWADTTVAIGRLPDAEPQPPACGCCGGDTDCYDVDDYRCDDCGLSYDRHMVASYVDDDARPCAKSCTASWHRPDSLTATPGWVYECRTCALPTGHTSECWTNCTTRKKGVRVARRRAPSNGC